ncbi:hypothetical protein BC936DRAFT_143762 [Jimgerdemannia flammicorona]|uniref:Uncharacterized protein n=1 Tax=Jimgerdemannia flammicorona TaxID=994334 RepID=A0A433DMS7_9FUNG|nr:hypothetical protein BC936DRAFT_143762 [Jimgerdemannia flammicorona]
MCVQKARDGKLLNPAEILALNHIFLFDEDVEDGLRDMFDGELWLAAVSDIKKQFASYHLSDNDILRCHAMSEEKFWWILISNSLFDKCVPVCEAPSGGVEEARKKTLSYMAQWHL